MKQLFVILTAITLGQTTFAQYNYPTTKTVEVSDTYWGVTVKDPYRWLEDLKNPEVEKWFKDQAEYTNTQLAKIPNQDKLISELKALDNVKSVNYSPIAKAGGKYFYKKRLPDEQVSKLYYQQGENGKEILLFDPQNFVEGKTYDYSLSVSDDGSKIAMNLNEVGIEVGDVHILDVATGKFLPDVIPHSIGRFAEISSTDLYYQQFKIYDIRDGEITLNMPFKLHVIGTPVEKDVVLVSAKNNPELNILPQQLPRILELKDSPYIILGLYSSVDRNPMRYYAKRSELKSEKINWKPLATPEDEVRNLFIKGTDIYFLTSKGNPKFKIIKTSLDNPDLKNAKTIVEGNDEWQLSPDGILDTKDFLIFNKTKDELVTKTYQYEFKTGKISEINVPLKGNILPWIWSYDDNELLLANTGWTTPFNIYSYNAETKKFSNGIFYTKFNYPNIENIVYEQVEVPSWDGTLVPLSIVYDKTKLKKDGSNIAFMQGYGAGGFNYTPYFDANNLPLLNRGVILAVAHVRGGGEKGNEWHLAGKKTTKPNTWKDFIACTEWLINNQYTSSDKFGISGGSSGGILIGRAITERPDLYRVAIPQVGDLNTLRIEFATNGPAYIPEYGTVEIEEEFKALLEMDSYHNIQKGVKYPAQLITTGWNDPRVPSFLPAKFAGKMQNENGSQYPVFLDVNYAGGHFGGSTIDERFAQTAKEYAFLLWQCGNREFQP